MPVIINDLEVVIEPPAQMPAEGVPPEALEQRIPVWSPLDLEALLRRCSERAARLADG